uniref:Bestrophin homolog n=1 Tax=Parastrongyloides trichosuri TaxID=131310 RepID=A0A0N4ZLX5_PARTI
MTIQYTKDITENSLWCNIKVLFYWKGSLIKSIYVELIAWCLIYATISIVARLVLNEDQQLIFDKVVFVCLNYTSFIPITFMLGFYVTFVLSRWVTICENLAFVDTFSIYICEYISGEDLRSKFIRRSILRYMATAQVLVYRDISKKAREMFPSVDSMIEKGFITDEEYQKLMLTSTKTIAPWWIPVKWAINLLVSANKEGRLNNGFFGLQDCLSVIMTNRNMLQTLLTYDWFPVPLCYTQIVALTVRTYFLIGCVGRQYFISDEYTEKASKYIDLYVPFLSMLQFIFYIGWLKVGEALVNPLGSDDDNAPVNFVLTRNLTAGLNIIDGGLEFRTGIVRKNLIDENKGKHSIHKESTIIEEPIQSSL